MASSPTTSWQTEGEKAEEVTDFLFMGSKITVEGDCSHEIRRWLLLSRKAMTNLDSVLKSKDVTLPTKVCIVKAMVFPLVTYSFDSWMVQKAEGQRINTFELWCWRRLLRVPWTTRRSNKSILKEISPEYWKNRCWEGNRQEGQVSPNRGNSLQVSEIFLSLKRQEETN